MQHALQAASSLRMPKDSSQDAQKIFSTCSHLNSLQMNTLLMHVQANEGEAVVSEAVVKKLVALATLHTDKQLQAEGRSIHLEEDISLELPFHVPEDRYYCDGLVGVPSGLQEYLEPSVSAGEWACVGGWCGFCVGGCGLWRGGWCDGLVGVPSGLQEYLGSSSVHAGVWACVWEGCGLCVGRVWLVCGEGVACVWGGCGLCVVVEVVLCGGIYVVCVCMCVV